MTNNPSTRFSTFAQLKQGRWLLWKEAFYGYLFVFPWVLGFFIFTAYPMIAGAYYSFTEYEIFDAPRWVGMANYTRIFSGADELVGVSIRNTLYYVFLAVPATLIAGLALALLLNQSVRGIAFFRTLFYMPSIVPIVASIAVLMWIFHGQFGIVNLLLKQIGISGPAWLTDPDWVKGTLVIWAIWNVGGGMIINLAGLQAIPQHLYEAAEIDGANSWQRFWRITIPMLSSTIFFNLIIGIIGTFQVFVPALLLGGTSWWTPAGGPLNSLLFYVLYIYQNGFIFFKMGYASALAWVMFIVVLLLTLVQFWLAGRWVYYEADVR
ncbi:MAG: sugar ABC transporter permease [Caldilineaceae bacterium]